MGLVILCFKIPPGDGTPEPKHVAVTYILFIPPIVNDLQNLAKQETLSSVVMRVTRN
jgi:hypothetical protein